MEISQADVERIAELAADKAVASLFRNLGIRSDDPFAMQKDFAFLREWRESCEMIRGRGIVAMITIGLTTLGAIFVLGLKQWLIK